MNIETLNKIRTQLELHEGKRFKPYYCSQGYLTIGIGRNLDTNYFTPDELEFILQSDNALNYFAIDLEPDRPQVIEYLRIYGLQEDDIELLFYNDIMKCDNQLKHRYQWYDSKPEIVKLVLLDMCFNLGISGLSKFVNTMRYIQESDYIKASENMLLSKWAKQVGKRAIRLSEMIKTA